MSKAVAVWLIGAITLTAVAVADHRAKVRPLRLPPREKGDRCVREPFPGERWCNGDTQLRARFERRGFAALVKLAARRAGVPMGTSRLLNIAGCEQTGDRYNGEPHHWDLTSRNASGALGPWQMMPEERWGYSEQERLDPVESTKKAVAYYKKDPSMQPWTASRYCWA